MASTDQQHTDTAVDNDTWMIEVDGQLVPDYDRTLTNFSEGDVVSGTVVRVDKDEILVDIGYKSEGVIPISELSIRRSVNPDEEVTVGDQIDALVLQKEDADGRLILSKKRARFEKAWRRIEAAAESGEPVEGAVIEVVKGGLIIDLGVRGFLPASLVDIRRVQDLDEYRDQTLRCKVIELNRSRNNVVLSRRAVLEEERREQRQQILDRLSPGAEVEGVISNIVDFGAFVDLDGIDGLIHISELSWSHVNHPSEVLEIGQTVKVKVLDVDRDRQRISLGLKQTQTDPWQRVIDETHQGDVVVGRITKVVTFGAFAEILSGVEGLIHISELADHHVENPRDVVNQGDEVNVKVIEIDAERRRLSLSLKRVEAGETVKRIEMDGTTTGIAEQPMPNLGLSEEVFADVEPEGERGRAGAPSRISPTWPRSPIWPPSRSPSRKPSLSRPAEAEPEPRKPKPSRSRPRKLSRSLSRPRRPSPSRPRRRKSPPRSLPPKRRRRSSAPAPGRRVDRRHRVGQVGGAGRVPASRCVRALQRRGGARAVPAPGRDPARWPSTSAPRRWTPTVRSIAPASPSACSRTPSSAPGWRASCCR